MSPQDCGDKDVLLHRVVASKGLPRAGESAKQRYDVDSLTKNQGGDDEVNSEDEGPPHFAGSGRAPT